MKVRMVGWMIVCWVCWPLYRMGWRNPYGRATGRYAKLLMARGFAKNDR